MYVCMYVCMYVYEKETADKSSANMTMEGFSRRIFRFQDACPRVCAAPVAVGEGTREIRVKMGQQTLCFFLILDLTFGI